MANKILADVVLQLHCIRAIQQSRVMSTASFLITTHAVRMALFSGVSVCVSVNTITPEPLEIPSRNFQGIILWLKGQTRLKMAIQGCAAGDLTPQSSCITVVLQ